MNHGSMRSRARALALAGCCALFATTAEAQVPARVPPPQPFPGPRYPWGAYRGDYPEKLAYREGAPVRPGYHVETETRKGVLIDGLATFAGLYGLGVFSTGWMRFSGNRDADRLFIPVVGPFAAGGREAARPHSWPSSASASAWVS